MVDLHSHLLPGIDDGSRSFEETLRCLRGAAGAGYSAVAITPHLNLTRGLSDTRRRLSEIVKAFDAFEARLATAAVPLQVCRAQEVCAYTAEDLRGLANRPDVGYAGTDWVLIEFGFPMPGHPDEVLAALAASGRRALVAHVERYHTANALETLRNAERWRSLGAVLQVNVGSLLGLYTPGDRERAWRLLDEGLASVVATDHHSDHRPHDGAPAFAAINERYGKSVAHALMAERPARVLANRTIR